VFRHVQHVASARALEGVGACVVMATPSMLQSGLSRELFEAWRAPCPAADPLVPCVSLQPRCCGGSACRASWLWPDVRSFALPSPTLPCMIMVMLSLQPGQPFALAVLRPETV